MKDANDPRNHVRVAAARWRAFELTSGEVRQRLGGHSYQARHRVAVTVDGKPDQSFEDRYVVKCTGKGACYARQDNSLEYGVELYRLGELTYFRHRYQRFMRFPEEPQEAARRIEHIWGAGGAVVELLRRHMSVTPAGAVTAAGRKATRYRLSLGASRVLVRESGPRAWRALLKPLRIVGEAALDNKTGVALSLQITYDVRVPKDGHIVKITGEFRGALSDPGKNPVIKPPADYVVAQPRAREVQQLQMLGSHRRNPGWFRGGGSRHRRSDARRDPDKAAPRSGPPGMGGMREGTGMIRGAGMQGGARPDRPRPRVMGR
ncbi:MAG: hypothetical protein ABI333_05135 [bacterium]